MTFRGEYDRIRIRDLRGDVDARDKEIAAMDTVIAELLAVARESVASAKGVGPVGGEFCGSCGSTANAHMADCSWASRLKRWDAVLARHPEAP